MSASLHHAAAQRRAIWPPEPGFFALSLVRRGWRVPARIVRTSDGQWQAEVDEVLCDPHTEAAYAPMLSTIWHSGLKISEADYHWLIALKDHARRHDLSHPSLWPRKPINPRTLTPIQPLSVAP